MNSCLECGADNAEDVIFCAECGKRLAPPQPPPEFWRYNTEDLGGPRPVQPIPPAYQPPPSYTNQPPPYAPEQGGEQRQGYAPRPGYAQPPQGYAAPQPQNVRPYAPPAPYQPPTPAPYPPAPLAQTTNTSSLPKVGMTLAVVVACVVLLGLVPCLGWLNWFAIIFGKFALITCIVALVSEKDPSRRGKAVAGLIILGCALGVAVFRLVLSLVAGGAGCI
ncbi:MAG TPA: hypothetical protein VM936_07175 [Pyrinomonadaceae bacterium]|jgi:hypothetical protein|nr:hypothetical protein [Pyrinomonadaceae bacterium]